MKQSKTEQLDRIRNFLRDDFYSNNYAKYESNGDSYKTLTINEQLDQIKPYRKDIINNLEKGSVQKNQVTTAINFKYTNEERVMHSKNDNIEIMINDQVDEVIK